MACLNLEGWPDNSYYGVYDHNVAPTTMAAQKDILYNGHSQLAGHQEWKQGPGHVSD